MKVKGLILFAVLVMLLVGCVSASGTSTESSNSIERYVDEEAGVVCWIYTAAYRGGLDCMPIGETLLGNGGN